MTEIFSTVAGFPCTRVKVTAGNTGPWVAECALAGAETVSGRVTVQLGALALSGTVDPGNNGTFGLQRKLRVVGGAGSWGNDAPAKDYHSDAGVKARTIADDAARAVGETIGTFVPTAERVGVDYTRPRGPAVATLERAAAGAAWWVYYAGVTHVGPRAPVTPALKSYTVLAYEPRSRVVTLAVDDPSAIVVGSVIAEGLDGPQTVRELVIDVSAAELRITAWCGGAATGAGQLAGLVQALVARANEGPLWGTYRYRVVRMSVDRVELQIVRKASGLPDMLPLSMWPGIAGAHAVLTPGAEVLVEFIEGDRTMPVVTHFAGKDGAGFVPVHLTLGGEIGAPAARQGDAVEVLLPPAVFSGTIGGTPATGVLTFPLVKTLGVITAGSSKVGIAT
jgi:hypothetical protein